MAITYQTKSAPAVSLVIGGQSSHGTGVYKSYGILGPFPRYSISRENIFTGAGTSIGTTFTITVTGTAILNQADDEQDPLEVGERQKRVQGEVLTILQFAREQQMGQSIGLLQIQPYGGKTNKIKFADARLTSIEVPEQGETAGIQNTEYTFTFEATREISTNTNDGKTTEGKAVQPRYNLAAIEENWELSENEGTISYVGNDPDSAASSRKTYTLTHTVSATGLNTYEGTNNVMTTNDEAFRQAAQWVATRLVADPMAEIQTDMMGDSSELPSGFTPADMNDVEYQSELGFKLSAHGLSKYGSYNHIRQISHNMAEGSYAVTDSWLLSQENVSATHEIEFSYDASPQSDASSISVNATIQGLSTKTSLDQDDNKYNGALASFHAMRGLLFAAANNVYKDSGGIGTLRDVKASESISHNKVGGSINYNVSYNDLEIKYSPAEDVISETIGVNYNNDDNSIQIIALQPILERELGPVIQDMRTTKEKTVGVTVDLVMASNKRSVKPSAMSMAEAYKPIKSAGGHGPYLTNKTESYNPKTGAYSLTLDWTYT
tara:strand:- start:474 stop:2123 length:1650 start_codon:yes stop_codon:yes gene_type:complete